MNRVGEFEKVSFEQFRIAMDDAFHDIGYTEDELREIWEAIPLPVRATSGSAGYDFKSPIPFILQPGKTIKIPSRNPCED